MSIPEAMHALLTAALPGVPILLPEDASLPGNYAPLGPDGLPLASGDRGLMAYLAAHPEGFVQIGRAVPMGRGLIGRYWYPITTVSPTLARTAELSELVFTRLCGDPVRAPGQFRPQFHAPPEEAPPGLWSSTLTVEAALMGGVLI